MAAPDNIKVQHMDGRVFTLGHIRAKLAEDPGEQVRIDDTWTTMSRGTLESMLEKPEMYEVADPRRRRYGQRGLSE